MKRLDIKYVLSKSAFVLLTLGLFVVGCSKEAEPETPVDPFDKPYARMDDKAYTKALQERMDKRMEIYKRMRELEDQIKTAEAKEPKSAEVEALKAKREGLRNEYDANKTLTEQLIRARILQENAAIEARKARENKKNNISSKGN